MMLYIAVWMKLFRLKNVKRYMGVVLRNFKSLYILFFQLI